MQEMVISLVMLWQANSRKVCHADQYLGCQFGLVRNDPARTIFLSCNFIYNALGIKAKMWLEGTSRAYAPHPA